jgi:tol-pal system protein YbgF
MTRHWFLPYARPTLLLALVAIAAAGGRPAVAQSQDATTQERLDRIERDLSMLQRQVYRDGVSPGDDTNAGAGSNLAVDTQIRMDRLEQQMRELTGKVEDQANEVQQLRQHLDQINSDIDVRFGELNQGPGEARAGARAAAAPPPAPPPGMRAEGLPANASGETADLPGAGAAPPGALVPIPDASGTLTPPGASPSAARFAPQAARVAAGEGLRPPPPTLPSAPASAQYNSAFGLLRRADYSAAENAFRSFLQQHPDSGLAGNAQYWLGESYYARGKYGDAAVAFAEGYKRYPKGPKASDTLLKLAMALGRADQKQNACIAFSQLDHDFQHLAIAVKQRAATEKKRFGC